MIEALVYSLRLEAGQCSRSPRSLSTLSRNGLRWMNLAACALSLARWHSLVLNMQRVWRGKRGSGEIYAYLLLLYFPRSHCTNPFLVKSHSLICGAVVHLTTVNAHINKGGPSGVIRVTHQHLTLTQAVEQAERRVWHDCLNFRPRCCWH